MKPYLSFSKRVGVAFAVVCAVVCVGGAHADEGDPIEYGVSQSLQYDDNLFRLPDGRQPTIGDKRQDWTSNTSLLLNLKKDIGRHSLSANLSHGFVKFFEYDRFDYQAEDYKLAWRGGFGSDSSYALAFRRQKTLSNFADVAGSYKNVASTNSFDADLSLRVLATWYLVGTAGVRNTDNSAQQEKGGESESTSVEYGVRYDPRSGNWVDLRARNAHVHYPNAGVEIARDNTFDESELRLSGHWQPTFASIIDARISYVDREHAHLPQRNIGGWSGNLDYTWRPDGVVSLRVSATRAIGAITDFSATYATTDSVSISPAWIPSAKLRFEAKADWRRRIYKGDNLLQATSVAQRQEYLRGMQISAIYYPSRTTLLQASLRREKRQSNDADYQYTDNTMSLVGQISF